MTGEIVFFCWLAIYFTTCSFVFKISNFTSIPKITHFFNIHCFFAPANSQSRCEVGFDFIAENDRVWHACWKHGFSFYWLVRQTFNRSSGGEHLPVFQRSAD